MGGGGFVRPPDKRQRLPELVTYDAPRPYARRIVWGDPVAVGRAWVVSIVLVVGTLGGLTLLGLLTSGRLEINEGGITLNDLPSYVPSATAPAAHAIAVGDCLHITESPSSDAIRWAKYGCHERGANKRVAAVREFGAPPAKSPCNPGVMALVESALSDNVWTATGLQPEGPVTIYCLAHNNP